MKMFLFTFLNGHVHPDRVQYIGFLIKMQHLLSLSATYVLTINIVNSLNAKVAIM